jgi:hypothetical protein
VGVPLQRTSPLKFGSGQKAETPGIAGNFLAQPGDNFAQNRCYNAPERKTMSGKQHG